MEPRVRIGCAGWALDKAIQSRFPPAGTHLERYAAVFSSVEINSSFYKPHQPKTYRRWAESVPAGFRFSAKVPKEITHTRRLRGFEAPLDRFLSEVMLLGDKLGPLLIQLPPSARFEAGIVAPFLEAFRSRFDGFLALEPRHPTWFARGPESLLRDLRIARVAADPAVVPEAAVPGGWEGLVYRRLHGSPKMYYSDYDADRLDGYAASVADECAKAEVWCVFDNTAEGHAVPDALALADRLPEAALAVRV
jgi:uncharacterized protein YecE (DUF72 family)